MAIILDHQLREQIIHESSMFPVAYYCDELAALQNCAGPLHWHPEYEIATAVNGALDFQIGRRHIVLHPGDSIFINGNVLHGIRQLSGDKPESMPNIVFLGEAIAPQGSMIYQKYIQPIVSCEELPFVVFNQKNCWHSEVNRLIKEIYNQMEGKRQCYEMAVQRDLSRIFEYIFSNLNDLPKTGSKRIQIHTQIRIQKMLSYIYEHYAESITLEDISKSADISRSEAGRCFHTYVGCSPIEALIRYRLQIGHKLLNDKTLTIQEISDLCGFNSVSYFSRQYRKMYGCTPAQNRKIG